MNEAETLSNGLNKNLVKYSVTVKWNLKFKLVLHQILFIGQVISIFSDCKTKLRSYFYSTFITLFAKMPLLIKVCNSCASDYDWTVVCTPEKVARL